MEFEAICHFGNILNGVYSRISIAVNFKERRYLCDIAWKQMCLSKLSYNLKVSSHQYDLVVKAEGNE